MFKGLPNDQLLMFFVPSLAFVSEFSMNKALMSHYQFFSWPAVLFQLVLLFVRGVCLCVYSHSFSAYVAYICDNTCTHTHTTPLP